MNILLTNYYKHNEGGAGVSAYLLAKGLSEEGHTVYVASRGAYPGYKTEIFRDIRLVPVFFLRNKYLEYFFGRLIKKYDIDVVHSCECKFTSLATVMSAQKQDVVSVLHFRGYWHTCLKGDLLYKNTEKCGGLELSKCMRCLGPARLPWELYKYQYYKKRIRRLNQADLKIAVSQTLMKTFEHLGFDKNTALINDPLLIPGETKDGGAFAAELKQTIKGRKAVLFVGMLIYHRGIDVLLDSIRRISSMRLDTCFLIAGDGEDREKCENYFKEYNIDNAYLLGNIDQNLMGNVYEQSDVVYFPAIIEEPFGRVVREAMSYGKAVVASDLGGLAEAIVDGKNGFLVKAGDSGTAVDKINELLDNEGLRKEMGMKGLASIQRLDHRVHARDIISWYTKLSKNGQRE